MHIRLNTTRRSFGLLKILNRFACLLLLPSKDDARTPSAKFLHSTTCNTLSLPLYATISSSHRGHEGSPIRRFSPFVSSILTEFRTQQPSIQRNSLTSCSNASIRPCL